MNEPKNPNYKIDEMWHTYLTEGFPSENRQRKLFSHLPKNPRCEVCSAPFSGVGGALVKLVYDKRPSTHNPRICNVCEKFAEDHPGGAELEFSMLFADVRGSTSLAERMSPKAFSQLINRFYNACVGVLSRKGAIIDRLVGDQMVGYFIPGILGQHHPRHAIEAAQELLEATGHTGPEGPWIPVGVGVHCGVAYLGVVGNPEGVVEITALGDAVNTTARIAEHAGAGEVLISEDIYRAADLDLGLPESYSLALKGRTEPVWVRSVKMGHN